jgi:hypothetical protein
MRSYFYFIFILSIFTTLVKYEFGYSDQMEHIPLIINEMNADYLRNDFFVAANETFGPRFYYSKFMAIGGNWFGLPLWFFILSATCAFATAVLTFLTVFKIFQQKNIGLLGAIFVLILPTPTLAESTFVTYEGIMTPSALVFPMLIGGFYLFFTKRNIVLPMLLVGIASLFQVLYGLTAGLLMLWAYLASSVRYGVQAYPLRSVALAVLVLGLFAAANLLPYYGSTVSVKMTTEQFVDIVAYFRNPHHYVPTHFPWQSWLLSLFFFGAAGLAFFKLYLFAFQKRASQTSFDAHFHFQTIMITVGILGGFVLGYVFVEIFPSRLVTTAQTFRYVILLKWSSCIYLAVWIGKNTNKWAIFAALHPVSLAFAVVGMDFFSIKTKNKLPFFNLLLIGFTLVCLVFFRLREDILVLEASFLFAVFLSYQYWNAAKTRLLFALLTLGLAVSPFISQRYLPPALDALLAKVYPKYDFQYRYDADLFGLSQAIETQTKSDDILIVPPHLSAVRFSANRAIVVDFKAIPYQDDALLEWRQRIRDCYGETEKSGFEGQALLSEAFKGVTFEKLTGIGKQYQANFAVVEKDNPIKTNVVFENEGYKLIYIASSDN